MDYIDRETGQFPVSIGTSLAVEGLLQMHPAKPPMPSGHRRINHVWVNLRTMIRNFYAAMSSEHARKAPMEASLQVMLDELQTLTGIFEQSQRKFHLTVYYNDLENLRWEFPHARYKEPKTERQLYFQHAEALLTKLVLDQVVEQQLPVTHVKKKPASTNGVVAIITHHPYELLWRFEFDSMFLLESHTGKLKTYSQWFTKLNGVEAEDHIPFNRLTLQLFGDGVLFDAFPKKLRDELKQVAHVRKWTAITTMDKIKDDIRQYGGETLKQTCLELA